MLSSPTTVPCLTWGDGGYDDDSEDDSVNKDNNNDHDGEDDNDNNDDFVDLTAHSAT